MFWKTLVLIFVSGSVITPPMHAQEKSCVSVGYIDGGASGTIVARRGDVAYVLTAKHVIDSTKKGLWVAHSGNTWEATFVAVDPHSDMALVSAKMPGDPVKLASVGPMMKGDLLQTWGSLTRHQKGEFLGETKYVENTHPIYDGTYFAVPGDSGCGVFNASGELLGLHYAGRGPHGKKKIATSVRLSEIKAFLSRSIEP